MDLFTLYLLSKSGSSGEGISVSLLNQYFDLNLPTNASIEEISTALSEKDEEYQNLNNNIEYYYTRMDEVYSDISSNTK